jgi:hypothetical protein
MPSPNNRQLAAHALLSYYSVQALVTDLEIVEAGKGFHILSAQLDI